MVAACVEVTGVGATCVVITGVGASVEVGKAVTCVGVLVIMVTTCAVEFMVVTCTCVVEFMVVGVVDDVMPDDVVGCTL